MTESRTQSWVMNLNVLTTWPMNYLSDRVVRVLRVYALRQMHSSGTHLKERERERAIIFIIGTKGNIFIIKFPTELAGLKPATPGFDMKLLCDWNKQSIPNTTVIIY